MIREDDTTETATSLYSDLSSTLKTISAVFTIVVASFVLPESSFAVESFDEFFHSRYQDPRKVKARNELNKLKTFQDNRLRLCEDKGIDWEQCFMFGEFPKLQTKEKPNAVSNLGFNDGSKSVDIIDQGSTSQRPPTW